MTQPVISAGLRNLRLMLIGRNGCPGHARPRRRGGGEGGEAWRGEGVGGPQRIFTDAPNVHALILRRYPLTPAAAETGVEAASTLNSGAHFAEAENE